MFDKPFHLKIIAPERIAYKGEAVSVTVPGSLGMFQVLFNHAPILAELVPGPLKIRDASGNELLFAVGGGFVEVRDNVVNVLADSVESMAEINVDRAKDARDRAVRLLKERMPGEDLNEAQGALNRAHNRLRVAGNH